jgi:MFS family permease
MLYGIYCSFGAVVASITAPFLYTALDNAIFGGVFIFFGVLGSFVLGVYLDKSAKYKFLINMTSGLSMLFILLGLLTLPFNKWLFTFNLALVGFTVIPIIPISYGFAVELTFPVPEAMSNGMMILPSQIIGALMGVLAGFICGLFPKDDPEEWKKGPKYTVVLFGICAFIGFFSSIFIKEELRRLKPQDNNHAN